MISADTNIFAYAYQDDEPEKQAVAKAVLARLAATDSPVALQVIGELNNVLRRKLKKTPAAAAQAARDVMTVFPVFAASRSASEWALTQAAAASLQYWDALLIASASEAGIRTLITEDLADGAIIGGVFIVNPFGAEGMSAPAKKVLEL